MNYSVGQSAEFSKTITESDVYIFAGISGDFNSVHINREKAKNSIFGKQVVHGALVNSFISTVLGMRLPGEGTIYMMQESRFLKPVFFGDTITAKVEILEIDAKGKAKLRTCIYNQHAELVVDGSAIVKLPS